MRVRAAAMGALALGLAVCAAGATTAMAGEGEDKVGSHGTLVACAGEEEQRCLWADREGRAVAADELVRQLMQDELLSPTRDDAARRRLEAHMRYIEGVHTHAAEAGLAFSYRSGVSARHLYEVAARGLSPREFVQQEQRAVDRRRSRRRLQQAADGKQQRRLAIPDSLNWCSSDNPRNASICTDVKSQQQCGSCWAFAAADAIEAAVVVNSHTEPQSLSPQQFLACSTSSMATTFEYCWVGSSGVDGASWLEKKMTWGSDNNGCDGGMTHAAFEDAATQNWSLLTQLDLPYDEEEDGSQEYTRVCQNVSETHTAAASITGWEQIVGKSCDNSSDAGELLRLALQQQPISVAINSGGSFKDYKSGIYECPDDGDFTSSSEIDHALVLVGYGTTTNATTNEQVDYWILKNSYGSSWGENGFMRLAADDKINCGLSVFPVIPTGAEATSYRSEVDGGGSVVFCGLKPAMWIATGGSVAALTVILTGIGLVCARRRRRTMKLVGE